jgi:hypothetical protein
MKGNFHVLPTIQNSSNLNIAPENKWMDGWMDGWWELRGQQMKGKLFHL